MKYTTTIEIGLPRERVIELFDSTENLYKWQKDLKKLDHISGDPGQEGAKSRLLYESGSRKIEMIETITKRNLPKEFSGTYEAKGVYNQMQNFFEPIDGNKTKWTAISEFKFSGFMRFLAFFMKGAFPKQTKKTMNAFKGFAEREGSNHQG